MMFQYDEDFTSQSDNQNPRGAKRKKSRGAKQKDPYEQYSKKFRKKRKNHASEFFRKGRPKIKLDPKESYKANLKPTITKSKDVKSQYFQQPQSNQMLNDLQIDFLDFDEEFLQDLDLDLNILQQMGNENKGEQQPSFGEMHSQNSSQNTLKLSRNQDPNPTQSQISQALIKIEQLHSHTSILSIIERLYEQAVVQKKSSSRYCNSWWQWDQNKDELLLELFSQFGKVKAVIDYFEKKAIKGVTKDEILNRFGLMMRKTMTRYNQEIELIRFQYPELVKLKEQQMKIIIKDQTFEGRECQIQLSRLYLSAGVQKEGMLKLSKKIEQILDNRQDR